MFTRANLHHVRTDIMNHWKTQDSEIAETRTFITQPERQNTADDENML